MKTLSFTPMEKVEPSEDMKFSARERVSNCDKYRQVAENNRKSMRSGV